jgi:hypothetical protein
MCESPDGCPSPVRVGSSNPAVKDRINCVNSRICNSVRECRLFIDPHCRQLIRDMEQVCWKTDANGNPLLELDKSDPMRTHTSDALGYYIAQEFPMRGSVGPKPYSLFGGGVFQ